MHHPLLFFFLFPVCSEQLIKIAKAAVQVVLRRLLLERSWLLTCRLEIKFDDILDFVAFYLRGWQLRFGSLILICIKKVRVRIHILLTQLLELLFVFPEIQVVKIIRWLLLLIGHKIQAGSITSQ